MPLSFVGKASRFCLHFMSGYREKLEGPLLDYAMEVYRDHRVVTEQSNYGKYLTEKYQDGKVEVA